jgi:hypothetical protein
MNTLNKGRITWGLTIALCAFAFLAMGCRVYAQTKVTESVNTKILSSTMHVETSYNAFGIAISSTETSTQTIQTTRTTDGKTSTSTQTSTSTVHSSWIGGSVKVQSVNSVSNNTSSDGSKSNSTSETIYSYNDAGVLTGAHGTGTGTGSDGKGGTNSFTTTDSYIVRDGQALRSQSITTGTSKGKDGTQTGTSRGVTNYTYAMSGGSWQLMRETSTDTSTQTDGNSENTTTTRSYTRNSSGLCTGMSQTKTGTKVIVGDTSGKRTYHAGNYTAIDRHDPTMGWMVVNEKFDWIEDK